MSAPGESGRLVVWFVVIDIQHLLFVGVSVDFLRVALPGGIWRLHFGILMMMIG